jgi:hypothetical protein
MVPHKLKWTITLFGRFLHLTAHLDKDANVGFWKGNVRLSVYAEGLDVGLRSPPLFHCVPQHFHRPASSFYALNQFLT